DGCSPPGRGARPGVRCWPAHHRCCARPCRRRSAAQLAATPGAGMTPYIRVLVTDDHPVVREGITAILDADPNIDVVGEAGSGEEAIAHVEVLHPDVVLLDLRLPQMSGINACSVIRQRFPRIGTLMLTATATHSALRECMDAGAHGFVSKNVGPATLREAV